MVFNGNGYGEDWLPEAEKRGLFVIPTQPDAIRRFTVPKNMELFEKNGVFTNAEVCNAPNHFEICCVCLWDRTNETPM